MLLWLLLLSLLTLPAHSQQPTVLTLGTHPLRTGVQRFGINLSGQNYWDSGQLARNLLFRNPGFESEEWQVILHCKQAGGGLCVDANPYAVWPDGFADNATFEVLSGPAAGATGRILHSLAARPTEGIRLTLSPLSQNRDLFAGDYIALRFLKPGHPDAGWWLTREGSGSTFPETRDLSPKTPGHQALRINTTGPGARLLLGSYFDTLASHSFVQLRGTYHLTFRAKPVSRSAHLHLLLERLDLAHGRAVFLDRDLLLKPGWNDYDLPIAAHEARSATGAVHLEFSVASAELLLDDVSLAASPNPANPTPYRDEVVQTLRDLHPGILRYMDNGGSFGSSVANLLAPDLARRRAGHSQLDKTDEDIALGLPGFLQLSAAVGAEPWITLPAAMTSAEARDLIAWLAGNHWLDRFPTLHLELGNEQWNGRSFAGAALDDPHADGEHTARVFAAMRSSPAFRPNRFDLVMGTWAVNPWWTAEELKSAAAIPHGQPDSTAIAPYLFSDFNLPADHHFDPEAVFGAMFAQPEQLDSRPAGTVAQQAAAAARAHTRLAVYEVNLGTMLGSAPQSAVAATAPSLAAGLAVATHMLLMLRDQGITTQSLFALPEYQNGFTNPADPHETTPLWGAVVDMGGATDLRRPTYLALQLLNQAILPNLLPVTLTGPNPTWNQPLSPTDKIALPEAHLLQAFAFADGPQRSLILLNLSRTQSLPIAFAGPDVPTGRIQQTLLTAPDLSSNNEKSEQVRPLCSTLTTPPTTLPPHSLTVLRWTTP